MKAVATPIDRRTISGLKVQTIISEDGCWVWQRACTTAGYPEVRINGQAVRVNRLIWEMMYGPIPMKVVIRHKCDNTKCINPEHLLSGTQKDNIHDAIERNRFIQPPVLAKLTVRQVREIREDSGRTSSKELSIKYRVSQGQIRKIRRGETWRGLE